MKKRNLLFIPIAACIIACAAAVGYIQHYPDRMPSVSPFSHLQSAPDPTDTQKRAQQILQTMTLEQKLYQMMFVRPETLTNVEQVTRAGDTTKAAIEAQPVGGIIYFANNFTDAEQTRSMLSNTQSYAQAAGAKIPLFMGVDEEGGTVARVASVLGTTAFENMAVYGSLNDANKAYEIGKTLAADISQFGFNVDFAPVADVLTNRDNTEIGARSFSSDPDIVSNMVSSEVKGLQENGVMATLKHFPGHGSTQNNSHDGTSVSTRTLEQFQSVDFKPFEAGIAQNTAFVLVSHMTAQKLDSVPCSLSSKVITGLLRDQLGYNGIVITDGLDMGAITQNYSTGDAAVKAVQAGADMLLCPVSINDTYTALSAAVAHGTITEDRINQSVLRILDAKLQYGLIN